METMEWYVKQLNLADVTEEQMIAGRFLESRGQRFLCEFGYENAVEKADALFDHECAMISLNGRFQ